MAFFSHEEAIIIKTIPLSQMEADVLTWPYLQDGQYSCKSGYQFLKEEAAMDITQDDVIMDSTLWKGIWTLQIPNKVKNLMWRACRDALPMNTSLVRYTIINNPFVTTAIKHIRCLYMLSRIERNWTWFGQAQSSVSLAGMQTFWISRSCLGSFNNMTRWRSLG